jgi:hypothetical protein
MGNSILVIRELAKVQSHRPKSMGNSILVIRELASQGPKSKSDAGIHF